jgi:hypothetical protein
VWFREAHDGVYPLPFQDKTDINAGQTAYFARPGPAFHWQVATGDGGDSEMLTDLLDRVDNPKEPTGGPSGESELVKVKVGATFISDPPWNYFKNR